MNPVSRPISIALAIAALGVELTAAAAPTDFRIIPAGEFRSWDGRPTECAAWYCTEEDGQRIVAELNARESARVIDYEHATLHAKKTGDKAPAAGWFKSAEWRADGVWLVGVDWTALAAQEIADKQYRYVSPVFSYDKTTGRVQSLYHAALTNDPGIDGLTDLAALAASIFLDDQPTEETAVNEELLEKLRWLLNLPVGAPAEDIAAHLQKLIDQIKGSNESAAAASFDLIAHLQAQHAQIATLSAQVDTPDPARFVPAAAAQELQAQVAALTSELNGGKVDALVSGALASGKLSPAMENWARDLGKSNLAALSAFIDAAPAVAVPGATQTGGRSPGEGAAVGQLTESQLAVCSAMGVSTEQFLATLKAETGQAA